MKKIDIGKLGENLATKYIISLGYKILERNFRCKFGEIDIIAKDKQELVFIEVKTRTNTKFGNPAEAVNSIKKSHILKTAKYYLYIHKLSNKRIRIEVIEIYLSNKYYINHIKQIEI